MIDEFNPSLSFEFNNSNSLFKNLLEEFEDFKRNPTKSRFAMNCAINSWHLTDWTFQEYFKSHEKFQDIIKEDKNGCKKKIPGVLKYQQQCVKDCPNLEYMRLITNGSKHCILNDKSLTQKTKLHKGVFSNVFSRQHDVSRFIIEDNGKELDFYSILELTIDYWKTFFGYQLNN
ncbi:hypothetical protein J2X31_000888 [Flavobacterium arsenatis]|uniref:YozE SAM-like domain-containing protein n=1 Tax=Flavobacterium arsenatis TaxID=1484332 RepID=A0ABU1TLZ1_9FLAO|nr:hypothetical protein [Flavobacterium arsenatis]MDR6966888.1 hypothetical protein [Flavobacterium arsenatis]